MVMEMNMSLPSSKMELINHIQTSGMKVKEELRTGNTIHLKVKSKNIPNYLCLSFILCPNANGSTEIKSIYKLNWPRLVLNAITFTGTAFVLILLNILLLKESILEGLALFIFNAFLLLGLYFKLIHISNEVLFSWMKSIKP